MSLTKTRRQIEANARAPQSADVPAAGDDSVADRIPQDLKEFEVRPDPEDPRLSVSVPGIDQEGRAVETAVVPPTPTGA